MLSEVWSTVLSSLQALAAGHQSAHWRTSGESHYGDHLMYQRMYDNILKETDQVAERMMGILGDGSLLDPACMLARASIAIKRLIIPGDPASSLLVAERSFLALIGATLLALEEMGGLTPGVENLLQGIADRHEEHVYLLSRRIGADAIRTCVKEA